MNIYIGLLLFGCFTFLGILANDCDWDTTIKLNNKDAIIKLLKPFSGSSISLSSSDDHTDNPISFKLCKTNSLVYSADGVVMVKWSDLKQVKYLDKDISFYALSFESSGDNVTTLQFACNPDADNNDKFVEIATNNYAVISNKICSKGKSKKESESEEQKKVKTPTTSKTTSDDDKPEPASKDAPTSDDARPHESHHMSGVGAFFLIIFLLILTYLVCGILYKRYVMGAQGYEQIPHYLFWRKCWIRIQGAICGRPLSVQSEQQRHLTTHTDHQYDDDLTFDQPPLSVSMSNSHSLQVNQDYQPVSMQPPSSQRDDADERLLAV